MNETEKRRLLVIALPAALLLAAGVLAVFLFLEDGPEEAVAPDMISHWHARYEYWVCGVKQPNAPEWRGGVHTHADGIIHIHPFQEFEQGRGARLVKWFEYGGGELTADSIRMPGERITHRNGDECPNGSPGVVQVYIVPAATGAEQQLEDWSEYIPQNGDVVIIAFDPY